MLLILVGAGAARAEGIFGGFFGDSLFVDPARYDLYKCDQLVKARAGYVAQVAQLQGSMAKAETGFAGKLVSAMAYQSDYLAAKGQLELIDKKRAEFKCGPLPVDPTPAAQPVPETKGKHKRHQ